MKIRRRALCLLAMAALAATLLLPSSLLAQQRRLVTIASGWVVGVYYPLAGAMSRIAYKAKDVNIRATVESSGASVANAQLVGSGDADFALLQNDIAYYAYNGVTLSAFQGKPVKNMGGVFTIYPELVHVVATKASGIKGIRDLKGKKVVLGPQGSGTEANAIQVMESHGLKVGDVQAERIYAKLCGRRSVLIYVDCNRAVAISAQGFYEVVLRSLLEALADQVALDINATLRAHHQEVTDATTAFNASLSFNLALTDLCEHLGRDLCLLIDEFDELYTTLDDRALLNLRALRDRFQDRLGYVTATRRVLPDLRGSTVEDEFAEMFARSTYPMPPLDDDEARQILGSLNIPGLGTKRVATCLELAGGHLGLLVALHSRVVNNDPYFDGDETGGLRWSFVRNQGV